MSKDGYNGWTNYETWNVALWWGESGMDGYWHGEAESLLDAAGEDADDYEDDVIRELADRMKDETTEEMPVVTGMWADLLMAAIGSVNWREIAEGVIEEAMADRKAA
jgi:hypothetical protein